MNSDSSSTGLRPATEERLQEVVQLWEHIREQLPHQPSLESQNSVPEVPGHLQEVWQHEGRFSRLRWSLFEPPSAIRVLELGSEGQPQWEAPLLASGPGRVGHALADEPATEPPMSRLRIVLDTVDAADYWHDADARDERPSPLVIENAGGEAVTISQLVNEFHSYAMGQYDIFCEVLGEEMEEHPKFYYQSCAGPSRSEAGAPAALFYLSDVGGSDWSEDRLEQHWGRMEKAFLEQSQSQQGS